MPEGRKRMRFRKPTIFGLLGHRSTLRFEEGFDGEEDQEVAVRLTETGGNER